MGAYARKRGPAPGCSRACMRKRKRGPAPEGPDEKKKKRPGPRWAQMGQMGARDLNRRPGLPTNSS